MQGTTAKALRNVHLLLDAAVIVASMALAANFHGVLRGMFPAVKALPQFQEFAILVYFVLPLWLVLIRLLGLDRSFEQLWTLTGLFLSLLKLHGIGLLGLSLVHFFSQTTINRSLVVSFLSCTFVLMYVLRIVLNRWARYQHRQGIGQRRIVLVGRESRRMANFVLDARTRPMPPLILGCLSAPSAADKLSVPPMDFEPLRSLGELSTTRLTQVLHDEAVDDVLFFPPENRPEELGPYVAICEELGIRASFSVNLVQVAHAAPTITAIFEHPFVSFEVAPKQPELLALKHGLDPVLAALLLVLLSPVLALTALAVLLTMGRPILFKQARAGLFGREFLMFKFRTMVNDAEGKRGALLGQNEMTGPVFKVKDDPRITSLGRFLRRTSMDELPQLMNVLLGSMSLVGPRPLPITEQKQIRNWQRRRLSMKPGITGLWQVSGRSQLDFEEWMLLDLKYVDDWSLFLDIAILARTLPVVLIGRGAH